MKTKKPESRASQDDPLVGRWFHSTVGKCEGCGQDIICWQGQILGLVTDDTGKKFYLVQLYEWLLGEETDQELVSVADVLGWKFYASAEAMRSRFEAFSSRHERCAKDSNETRLQ